MAINVVSGQYYGGFLPDRILLNSVLLPSGNPIKCHEGILPFQPMFLPKRFVIFSPVWGMLKRLRCVRTFLLKPFVTYRLISAVLSRVIFRTGTRLGRVSTIIILDTRKSCPPCFLDAAPKATNR